jgi:hypothetical protein
MHDGTVHVNLREQRTRILLDSEWGAAFVHIKGAKNTAADGLSRLEMTGGEPTETVMNELFAIVPNNLDREDSNEFPLDMKRIMMAQKGDGEIQRRINSGKLSARLGTKSIDGGDVITIDGLVWVPKESQLRIVEWYHSSLQHAGITRTVNSIGQVFTWKGLRPMVEQHILSCDECQRNKNTNKRSYGHIPLTPALRDKDPWEVVHVDCCGPWKIKWFNEETGETKTFDIYLMSMVDACTGWSEFARIDTAASLVVSKIFDREWLCRYARPRKVVHDNGKEFMGCEFQELLESYGIESKPTTVKNPTANGIVERIHGTLGEQLRATVFSDDWSDDIDTLIQACAFALRAASPARGTYSPAQLAFGYDMIFRQKVLIDWERIKALRLRLARENNAKENKKRLVHEYKVGDKVLLVFKPYERRGKISPSTHNRGPFTITEVIANGTVKIQCGAYVDIVSIRRITPYIQREEQ